MRSKTPGLLARVVQETIIVLLVVVTPAVPIGMNETLPPDLMVRFSGWQDVLGVVVEIIPEFSVIIDLIRFLIAIVSCGKI